MIPPATEQYQHNSGGSGENSAKDQKRKKWEWIGFFFEKIWLNLEASDKIQLVMAFINLATLITFILISGCQLKKTQESLDFAQKSFLVGNQAFILCYSMSGGGYDSIFTVKVKNFGTTPATKIKISRIILSEKEIEDTSVYIPMNKREYAFVLPGSERTFDTFTNIPYYKIDPDWDKRIFFVGKITYYNIFDNFRFTKFAGWISIDGANVSYLSFEGNLNKTQ